MRTPYLSLIIMVFVTQLVSCGDEQSSASQPTPDGPVASITVADASGLPDVDNEAGNWAVHGRTDDEQRYSPLHSIDRDTVARLGMAWQFKTGSTRGLEATPLVVDGVMYTTSIWSEVFALNAKTGELIWRYDPQVPRGWGKKLCCDIVNRGVAVWQGKVYLGTLDGRLLALNAATGTVLWQVDTLIDRSKWYSITGAPRLVKDKVIIGNGGAEYGVRGYVSAYDAVSGEMIWRFYTVPGDPAKPFEHAELEMAASSWDPDSDWAAGGGGTVWDSMAYDAQLDILYVGTGNGAPWARFKRSPGGGDNLFLASILALQPDTGRLLWHYQTTPGDSWDFTATQHMILADLDIDGQTRKVIMQAPKNGFFYVLDRQSGGLISAEKFVYVNWASHIDAATGRPVETDHAEYAQHDQWLFPSPAGAHNWQPMSYSPQTGYVYIPARDIGWVFSKEEDKWFTYGADNLDELRQGQTLPEAGGYVKAWDPVAQKEIWRFTMANIWNGGVLSTAGGLVFFGDASGVFYALHAETGAVLKQITLGTGVIAPPISYQIDGQQYIAVMAGWGGPAFNTLKGDEALFQYRNDGRVIAFKLDGQPVPLPALAPARGTFHELTELHVSDELVAGGGGLYFQHCSGCHGAYGSTPMLPDLRHMSKEKHALFRDIVLGGMLEPNGMASFADVLNEAEVGAIQAYIIKSTNQARAGQHNP